jgi:RNA-binding protein 23/39
MSLLVLQEAVVQAVTLGGQTLMGQTVMVKPSEAEKNLAWEAAQVRAWAMAL